ncbi:type II secretion system minor pseudopilin GspJ [Xanthomonas campestris pv. campestris]|nr:type II secretion system minor pseudopilin GspJ [Xanthomonas campestris]MEA0761182.1 type II secretion system minor pseudopilin GspJ [Xanthomonas campestris pv. campestris]MEB1222921.1 type II secretion system minor pseudopilin GspJ [Xanthomonas campestris pv. campestris]MEB1243499.1 type II secretion system minor pseudopilin GspJ [Xanthomonas campestris pv. campestris]MEB1251990.1 type II secretion system minor pseudopilin GspJ [Xanthomonas campestris pv. campestris]MEB1293384.1 type II se
MMRLRRAAGFTLIELLVALAVFALVAAAAVGVLRQSIEQRAAVQARLQQLRDFQIAHGLLRSDLQQAAVRRTRGSDGVPARTAFVATPPGAQGPLLAFVRRGWSNPDQAPGASLQYVEYRLVEDRLERSARPALDGAVTGAPQVLLRGVRAATVGFHYRAQWSDGWSGGVAALPDAVALELEMQDWGRVRQLFLVPEGRE